MVIFRRI